MGERRRKLIYRINSFVQKGHCYLFADLGGRPYVMFHDLADLIDAVEHPEKWGVPASQTPEGPYDAAS